MDKTSAPATARTNPSTRKPSPRTSVIRLVSMNMSALTPIGQVSHPLGQLRCHDLAVSVIG